MAARFKIEGFGVMDEHSSIFTFNFESLFAVEGKTLSGEPLYRNLHNNPLALRIGQKAVGKFTGAATPTVTILRIA